MHACCGGGGVQGRSPGVMAGHGNAPPDEPASYLLKYLGYLPGS